MIKRKIIIAAVWAVGIAIVVFPYFVGSHINKTCLNLNSISEAYLWSIGFIVCLCFGGGILFIVALWPIAEDIADWAEKKSKI